MRDTVVDTIDVLEAPPPAALMWNNTSSAAPAGGPVYVSVKRGLDVVFGMLALVVLAPVMTVVALAVRFTSPGPVLFRQVRAGRDGAPFTVIKFRTMSIEAGGAGQELGDTSDRSRITRLGRWLRRLYLDELPQFALIVSGKMSLVGPRPKRVDQAAVLEERIPAWRAKYSVRPGLTGMGQIRYGYASTEAEEAERLIHDLYYIEHRSMRLDMVILMRTALRVVRMGGH